MAATTRMRGSIGVDCGLFGVTCVLMEPQLYGEFKDLANGA